jgi:hypothetical protein
MLFDIASQKHFGQSEIAYTIFLLDRIVMVNDFKLDVNNVVPFVNTSIVLSCKIINDLHYGNCTWELIFGLPAGFLNQLEIIVLKILKYRTFMSSFHYNEYYKLLGLTINKK